MIMRLSISRFFILCGLFFPSLAPAVTPVLSLPNNRVSAYAEANYPDLFKDQSNFSGHFGIYQQYEYRYYSASGNYLGIDPMGNMAMLGPVTGNVLKPVGNVTDYVNDIIAWEAAQPITPERVFHYAENHYPDLFAFISIVTTRKLPENIVETCYPEKVDDPTSNCIGVSLNTGDIFIQETSTGELTHVGNVADYESAIRAWESKPNMRLDYPGFTLWMDCSRRSAMQFQYVPQPSSSVPSNNSIFLDPDVPADCQQTSTRAYDSNYTRGYLVPPNHLGPSTEAIKAANTMTNILPQAVNMNAGAWRRTEEITRCYSNIDELLVMGGVLWSRNYTANDHFIQSHGVETPDAFWKIIIRGTGQNQQAIAWIIPNSQEATWDRLDQYIVPLSEVRNRMHLHIPVTSDSAYEKPSQSWEIPPSCS
jgi:endonuclease G